MALDVCGVFVRMCGSFVCVCVCVCVVLSVSVTVISVQYSQLVTDFGKLRAHCCLGRGHAHNEDRYTHAYTCTHMHTKMHKQAHIHTHAHTNIVCMCVYIQRCTHTYIPTYTHC